MPNRRKAFLKLADASKYPVCVLPDAKGMVPETYPRFMGLYWGCTSSPIVCEVVESSDIVITVGAVWTDYTTVGYSLLLKPEKVGACDGVARAYSAGACCSVACVYGVARVSDVLPAAQTEWHSR